MELEVDHLFICCSAGASAEALALTRAGLREGSSRQHMGQGTENRCFFFENAYFELIWVNNEAEACSELTRPTRLWERWSSRQAGASPFGVALRPGATVTKQEPPFETWPYHPQYRSSSGRPPIAMADGTRLDEPQLFYLADAPPPTHAQQGLVQHAIPLRQLTGVAIGSPGAAPPSPALRSVEELGAVSFVPADAHVMTVTFDGGMQGRTVDLQPELPVVLRW